MWKQISNMIDLLLEYFFTFWKDNSNDLEKTNLTINLKSLHMEPGSLQY